MSFQTESDPSFYFSFFAGSEIGIPVRLGADGKNLLAFGLGIGAGGIGGFSSKRGGDEFLAMGGSGVIVSPTARYLFRAQSGLMLGCGIRLLLPVAKSRPIFPEYGDEYGFTGSIFFEIGYTSPSVN